MKHIKLFEDFTASINEASLKVGRDQHIAKAIIAYFYAVEGTPEGDKILNMGLNPVRTEVNARLFGKMTFKGWAKDAIKALSGASQVPTEAPSIGWLIQIASGNDVPYYFDDTDFVESDKTIIRRAHGMGFREFIDTLVKQGVISAPTY